ncbi:MAG: hypothetical protein U0610_20995 [bacterium]
MRPRHPCFETPRTVAVEVTPPEDSSVAAVGDRIVTPTDERIYGLTERLRDSPPPPPTGLPIEEQPVEQDRSTARARPSRCT